MNVNDVHKLVENEISNIDDLDNWHGITKENLTEFLVAPYEVIVDPDDGRLTEPRPMWVVLHQQPDPNEGYLIAFDSFDKSWAVLETTSKAGISFIQIISGKSLAEALDGM